MPDQESRNAGSPNWIDFVPVREGRVRCSLCGKEICSQRIARGAHAAWHKRQQPNPSRASVLVTVNRDEFRERMKSDTDYFDIQFL
jgi:hypothetical protein